MLHPDKTIQMPTIGILGVTIPGAIDFLSKLHKDFHGAFPGHHHPNIVLHKLDFSPTHKAQNAGEWQTVEDRLVESTQALVRAGANFVAIPANTVHKVIEGISRRTTIPVLNMIELVAVECQLQGLKKVGIMGTRWTMADHIYQKLLHTRGITEVIPTVTEQLAIQDAIFQELIPTGTVKPETLTGLLRIVDNLKSQGCDAVVLACTELPLVLNTQNCKIIALDTTAILATATKKHALALLNEQLIAKPNLPISRL